jgi:hypothetical protein
MFAAHLLYPNPTMGEEWRGGLAPLKKIAKPMRQNPVDRALAPAGLPHRYAWPARL